MIKSYENLLKLIQQGESKTLEFKKSTASLSEGCKTLSAFLNTEGGTVLFGVTDDGGLIGQRVTDKTRLDIDVAFRKFDPPAAFDVEYIHISDNNNHVVSVHASPDVEKRPYLYAGRGYMRGEAGNRSMTHEQLTYHVHNSSPQNHWEIQAAKGVSIDDLDDTEILGTVEVGIQYNRVPADFATQDPCTALQHLNLMVDGSITNGAVVLFGKNPEKFFPQCLLRLAKFRGIDKSEFIDSKRVEGNVFKLINHAMSFVQMYMPTASSFPEGKLERLEQTFLPVDAIREALVNAFCHRNYNYQGGSVSLAIYDDRMEIWSYGELPPGMTTEKLMSFESLPRNPRVAKALYYHKYFESWGRGVQKIMKLCQEAGHPTPRYQFTTGGILLTLYSRNIPQQATTTERVVHSSFSIRQTAILKVLEENPPLSTSELRDKLESPPSERTIREDLKKLHELGFVNATGVARARKWQLVK